MNLTLKFLQDSESLRLIPNESIGTKKRIEYAVQRSDMKESFQNCVLKFARVGIFFKKKWKK